MIGGRHCGDAAHHAEHWREQRPPVLEQQRSPDQEDSDAAEGGKGEPVQAHEPDNRRPLLTIDDDCPHPVIGVARRRRGPYPAARRTRTPNQSSIAITIALTTRSITGSAYRPPPYRPRDGTAGTLSGSPASTRSSITVDVAGASGRRNEGYGRASPQTSQLHNGFADAIANQGNGRGTRRWHPSITTGTCAT